MEKVLLAGIVTYTGIVLYLYFSQSAHIYFPTPQDFENCPELVHAEKITHNGTRMYYIQNTKANTLVVIYHGNGGSACDRAFLADYLNDQGVATILVEYVGYSNDTRTPSETLIFNDVNNVNSFIKSLNYDRLVILGESLGSGPATYHTTLTGIDSLILITPFTSLADAGAFHYPYLPVKLLIRDKYDNGKHLRAYEGKLTIIHGTNDTVIPFSLGQRLYAGANTQNKQFITIDGAGHNDIYSQQKTFDAISDAL